MYRRETSARSTQFGCRRRRQSHIRLVNGQAHPGAPADVRRGPPDLEHEEGGSFGASSDCKSQPAPIDEVLIAFAALRAPVQTEFTFGSNDICKASGREACSGEVSLTLPSIEGFPGEGTYRSGTQTAEHVIGVCIPTNTRIGTTKPIASTLTAFYRWPHVYHIPALITIMATHPECGLIQIVRIAHLTPSPALALNLVCHGSDVHSPHMPSHECSTLTRLALLSFRCRGSKPGHSLQDIKTRHQRLTLAIPQILQPRVLAVQIGQLETRSFRPFPPADLASARASPIFQWYS